jgi:hypothetical protein
MIDLRNYVPVSLTEGRETDVFWDPPSAVFLTGFKTRHCYAGDARIQSLKVGTFDLIVIPGGDFVDFLELVTKIVVRPGHRVSLTLKAERTKQIEIGLRINPL